MAVFTTELATVIARPDELQNKLGTLRPPIRAELRRDGKLPSRRRLSKRVLVVEDEELFRGTLAD
jgi:hypothetical protein